MRFLDINGGFVLVATGPFKWGQLLGPGRYGRAIDVSIATSALAPDFAAVAGVVIYIIIDEGSRLYPPRNLVPVP